MRSWEHKAENTRPQGFGDERNTLYRRERHYARSAKGELETTHIVYWRNASTPAAEHWYHSVGYALTFLGGVLVGYLLRFMKRGTAELLPPPPNDAPPIRRKQFNELLRSAASGPFRPAA